MYEVHRLLITISGFDTFQLNECGLEAKKSCHVSADSRQ